jgi:hypothetical protein
MLKYFNENKFLRLYPKIYLVTDKLFLYLPDSSDLHTFPLNVKIINFVSTLAAECLIFQVFLLTFLSKKPNYILFFILKIKLSYLN